MSNLTKRETFSLAPRNLDEAIKYSELISRSNFVPKDYKGKPGDILVAVQMGQDVGLPPMQALQNIAVINGRPSLWGDAALAICQNHPKYEYIKETIHEGKDGNHKAICIVKRKNEEEYKTTFSVEDAKHAGLWGRQGPWKTYPKRMLQMRARGFALRDKFSDALNGMILREEAEDYAEPKNITPEKNDKKYESKADMILDTFEDIEVEENNQDDIEDEKVRNIVSRLYNYGVTDGDIKDHIGVNNMSDLDDSHMQQLIDYGVYLKEKSEEDIEDVE